MIELAVLRGSKVVSYSQVFEVIEKVNYQILLPLLWRVWEQD